MIITNLMGGLGNQMFQYACARALSLRSGTELCVDLQFLRKRPHQPKYTLRNYELDIFALQVREASARELLMFQPYDRYLSMRWLRRKLFGQPILWDRAQGVQTNLLHPVTQAYLHGFWQSEAYFVDYAAQIREDFRFRYPLEPQNRVIADQILNSSMPTVSVHVRRGDYANLSAATCFHGLCTVDYYREAISLLRGQIGNDFRIFLFSDEPAWIRENLSFLFPAVVVESNLKEHAYRDMQLMAMCQHHVIANSSFSWWGAWLGQNAMKKVILPRRWLAQSPLDSTALGLVPSGWVAL